MATSAMRAGHDGAGLDTGRPGAGRRGPAPSDVPGGAGGAGAHGVETRVGDAIEAAIERRVAAASSIGECPPRLRAAMRHAVFPGGARLRPRLVLGVAAAVAGPAAAATSGTGAVAAAVELMHCASLVQDDLGCFDAADVRRGRPAVHVAFDERLAILASDALICAAFDALAAAELPCEARLELVTRLARRSGAAGGITAGQAWESESRVELERYHDAKTGSLFALSTEAGAIAAGAAAADVPAWAALGARVGAAYQIADDLQDATGDAGSLGKPVNVDARLERPSAAASLGCEGARARLLAELDALVERVPECPGRVGFARLLRAQAARFVPAAPALGGA